MLRFLTAGESHGKGLTMILEGMPAGLNVSLDKINFQLARRQKGYGRGGRMKIETDRAEITSGIRHGSTLGSPIALWVQNTDFRSWQSEMSSEYIDGFQSKKLVDCPRPGHADLTGGLKYNQRDLRNILERASARETTVRVACGAITTQLLNHFGIKVAGHVSVLGGVEANLGVLPPIDELIEKTENDELRCLDAAASQQMKIKIDEAKKKGDTLGGIFEIIVEGLPPGLGSHVQWDRKLDGQLAQALLSMQAIKGVEFGKGFELGRCFGSQAHDEIDYNQSTQRFFHRTNRAGGLEGGMSNGEPFIIRTVMKPISTLYTPLHSINIDTKQSVEASVERSDTCAVPAACVIAENIVSFTVARSFLEKFGGDSIKEIETNYQNYLDQLKVY